MNIKTSIFAFILLVMASAMSFAVNWVFVASGNSGYGSLKFYIDTESIRSQGSRWQAWVMVNLETPATSGDQVMSSIKYLYLFDLDNYRMAIREQVGYSEINGEGDVVTSQGPFTNAQLKWTDPVAGSYSDYLIKIVQKKADNPDN